MIIALGLFVALSSSDATDLVLCEQQNFMGMKLSGADHQGVRGAETFTGKSDALNIFTGPYRINGKAFLNGNLEFRIGKNFKLPTSELKVLEANKVLGTFEDVTSASTGFTLTYSDTAIILSDFTTETSRVSIVDRRKAIDKEDSAQLKSAAATCRLRGQLDPVKKKLENCFARILDADGMPHLYLSKPKNRVEVTEIVTIQKQNVSLKRLSSLKDSSVLQCVNSIVSEQSLDLGKDEVAVYPLHVLLRLQRPKKPKFKLRN